MLLLDAGLQGAVSGLVAVCLMTLFETPFWYRFGVKGVVQWQVNEIMVAKILSKPYSEGQRLPWAIAMHLFHGIALGAVLAFLLSVISPSFLSTFYLAAIAGLIYTIILWMFVPFSFRTRLERAGRVSFTKTGMIVSLLAHVIYGLSVGELLYILLG